MRRLEPGVRATQRRNRAASRPAEIQLAAKPFGGDGFSDAHPNVQAFAPPPAPEQASIVRQKRFGIDPAHLRLLELHTHWNDRRAAPALQPERAELERQQ